MSIAANSPLLNLVSENPETVTGGTDGSLANLGAELLYTQDSAGRYLTFYWQNGSKLGFHPEEVLTQGSAIFAPVDQAAYTEKLQRVLSNLMPEKCQSWFHWQQHLLELELTICPIIPQLGVAATQVLVMGRLMQIRGDSDGSTCFTHPVLSDLELTLRSQQHRQIVNEITRNIRRTLNWDIIWQQTVDSLGSALQLPRCIICPYPAREDSLYVIAEYRQSSLSSMLGLDIGMTEEPAFAEALRTLQPIVLEKPSLPQLQGQKILVVATCYQDKPNGLIAIALCDASCQIAKEELELAKEVADQLGTAIAHATLYKELEIARQQAEDASRLKSEFLANVSHELRTPLNGMIGFLKLIIDGVIDEPEEQAEFIQEAHKSSLHLLDIIGDLLDFAKIEAGKMDLDFRQLSLADLFQDVGNFMRLQAEQRRLSFQMQLPEITDEILVYGDYQRLKQVMLNLIGNAIKFTHEGGITVSADVVKKKVCFQEQEFPGLVRVRVADTGIGVSLDKQDKLFQLFSQVDGSRTRQYGGTGLGLAISQKLVEAMGGEVHFYSLGEGLGSTVTFTVPLYQQPVMI
ncbi:GAF domain-containing hybrid sensor histidine kinase/response regulator [Calothrix sp. 336/3]|uniref:GAF domain-containing hybrid sensor histidine kinase/response regulator n=1 Tax=Calothrix sp. 336/3 TaxID=1337936 RepID=UPI0004E42D15|nr:ATP-binding protein [Calothrix sp. 336/3]AKG24672.1 histidine kinase [Calothrix sp. 336/3]